MCTGVPTDPASRVQLRYLWIYEPAHTFQDRACTCPCPRRSLWSPLQVITIPVFVCSCVCLMHSSTRMCMEKHTHACSGSVGPAPIREHVSYQTSTSILFGGGSVYALGYTCPGHIEVCVPVCVLPPHKEISQSVYICRMRAYCIEPYGHTFANGYL